MSDRYKFLTLLWVTAIAVLGLSNCFNPQQIPPAQAQDLAGGETTTFNRTSSAYEQPSVGLTDKEIDEHTHGAIAKII